MKNAKHSLHSQLLICKLNSRFFICMMVALILLLVTVSFSMQVYKFRFNPNFPVIKLLDVDGEKNVPAFFSTFLLITAMMLTAFIGYVHHKLSKGFACYWIGLSAVFLYLAMDELISLHELFIGTVQRMAGSDKGIYHLGWVIPMGIFAAVFAAVYLRFVWQLPLSTRLLFVLSGVIYVFGALGMETIGSFYYQMTYADSLGFQAAISIEETLEMAGITFFIHALLQYIKQSLTPLTLRLHS